MKISIYNLVEKFLIPYYIYEGYSNIVIDKKNLHKEDIRYKYYNKYIKNNENKVPINPLKIDDLPELIKIKYIEMKLQLDKYIDFFDDDNYGIVLNKKIQLIDDNSYQDLYKYVYSKSINLTMKKYFSLYKPYPNICKLDDINDIFDEYNEEKTEKYLRYIYYSVNTFFNDMTNYNPCNFICYNYISIPKVDDIIYFLSNNDHGLLYKKWDNEIKALFVEKDKYFNSVTHHLFITSYLKSSNFLYSMKIDDKLKNDIKILFDKSKDLWDLSIYENNNNNYKNINPKNILKEWNDILDHKEINDINT